MAIASRNTERREQVATEILEGTDGGEVFPVGGSTCATPTQAGAMISHAKEAFGGVDILVNAAAGIPAGRRFAEIEAVTDAVS